MRALFVLALAAAAAASCCADPAALAPAARNLLPGGDDDKPRRRVAAAPAAPTTHALLSRLGMQKLRVPAAHHRKRLAEQARRHASGDSRMYVIKLPPSTSYYSHAVAAPPSSRTLPLPLHSNGKPGRVYHWNLPALHRQVELDKGRPQARLDDAPAYHHPNAVDAPAYYVPAAAEPRKHSFRKYFSGNGKPKSFYVIDKNKKPAHYHRLLP